MAASTIHNLLFKNTQKLKDNIAFNYFDVEWHKISYSEFLSSSKSIASYLLNEGINKGDRIAIVAENRPEWCISYIGIMLAGAITVPIDSQIGHDSINNLLHDSEAKVVFFSSKTKLNIKATTEGLTLKIIDINSDDFQKICRTTHISTFPQVEPNDTASIIYTSGTTGTPKGVMLTHRNFCSDAAAVIQSKIIVQSDNILSVLPLHHTYPFMCTFLAPVLLGATVTHSPSLKGSDIMNAIKQNHVTILIGVPQLLELIRNGILNKLKQLPFPVSALMKTAMLFSSTLRRKFDLNAGKLIFKTAHKALGKQFRLFTSGGAKLDPDVMKDLEAFGFTVIEGYGLTETSPVVTFNPIEKRKIGSAGKPLPSVEIKIVKTEHAKTIEGEIAIKGPMVMNGYYKKPDETKQTIRDKWFYTGDTGHVDKDGYLFITGRLKEVIVLSSGKNIYPDELEKEYLKIPLIKEICITELKENDIAETLHAVIVPDFEYAKQQNIGSIHDAIKWELTKTSGKLPSHMRIKGFTLYSEPLPRTPLGKLKRFMIKDLLKNPTQSDTKEEEDQSLFSDKTSVRIINCLKLFIKDRLLIHSDSNLELDLGFDSLKRIELMAAIENEFSIKLPETFGYDLQTVSELIEKIKEFNIQPQSKSLSSGQSNITNILLSEPSEEDKKTAGLKQNSLEWLGVSILMRILRIFLKIFFRLEVKGIENIPKEPYILTPNHCSNIDGFIVVAAIPLGKFKNIYFQGFQKYFTNILGAYFAKIAHIISIDPNTYLGKALQISGYVLKNNKSLCVFPEGGRSSSSSLMEFKKGIGILALEFNVPVVPAFIKGTLEALPRGSFLPKPKKITITFGKPFYPSELNAHEKSESIDQYQFFADELRKKVQQLSNSNLLS
jgi:long-chain acyl-CoA synthetase